MPATGVPTNRTNVDLPVSISREIMQKVSEASAVMRLARKSSLPGNGTAINEILSDPEAAWVGETEKKPVSNPGLRTKILRGYTLSVIVPFSNQFKRDLPGLYDQIVKRLPNALGRKFDNTVFFGSAPGNDFDTFAAVTAQDLDQDAYQGLVAADTDIADHDGVTNGYVISAKGKGILLRAVDNNKRPLFINSVAEGAIPMILGSKTLLSKGAYKAGNPATVGFAGDWTQAVWGAVEDKVQIAFSDQATLDLGNNETLNLFQQNMFAVRAEIEVGFRADITCFNALTASDVPSI